jgi:hypothetical protein
VVLTLQRRKDEQLTSYNVLQKSNGARLHYYPLTVKDEAVDHSLACRAATPPARLRLVGTRDHPRRVQSHIQDSRLRTAVFHPF